MSTEITTIAPFDDVEASIFEALNMVQSGVASPEQWLIDALGGGSQSASGAYVNYDTVLGIPSANRSINMITGHIGAMPKEVRQTLSTGGSENLPQAPAAVVANTFCNDLQSCFTLWQTMMSHALLTGNGRAFIARDGNSAPASMTVLMPNSTYTVVINGAKYHVTYFTSDQYNDVVSPSLAASLEPFTTSNTNAMGGTGYQYTIPDEEVFHIPGIGYTGMWGYPLLVLAKDTFGVEMAGLDAVSYQFSNGGRPGLIITAPRGMFRTEKAAMEWMSNFNKKHGGAENTGRTGLLTEGMTCDILEAPAPDKGLASLREMSQDDIALLFGTEYLLGNTSAVYKDLPDRFTAYVTNTLNQWMETIEQEGERKLLTRAQVRRGQYFHLDASALLRGSPNNLAEYTNSLRSQGLISGNEGREMHQLNPVPELEDDYGNPFVQTGSQDDESETEEETEEERDEEEADDAQARLSLALSYNFKSLIEYEARRVKEIAVRDAFRENGQSMPNLIDGIEKFYEGFADKLETTCRDLEVPVSKGTEHVNESKDRLAELIGVTAPANVAASITDMVSKWEDRAKEFGR